MANTLAPNGMSVPERPRVTASVEFLVMRKDEICRILQKFDTAKEFKAEAWMFPHRGPFIFVQLGGFPENTVWDFKLADVMQQCAVLDL
jgi:hypothetical protein